MHQRTWESLHHFAEAGELGCGLLRCAIRAPQQAVARAPVVVDIEADEGSLLRAWVQCAEGRAQLRIAADGSASFVPQRPGRYQVVAEAIAAGESPAGPAAASDEVAIEVCAPPVVIEVIPGVARAGPGATARFRWTVTGADRVEFHAAQRGHAVAVPPRGGIDVEIDALPEEFLLVAVGMDGAQREQRFATQPLAESLDTDISAVMRAVQEPWRSRAS